MTKKTIKNTLLSLSLAAVIGLGGFGVIDSVNAHGPGSEYGYSTENENSNDNQRYQRNNRGNMMNNVDYEDMSHYDWEDMPCHQNWNKRENNVN